MADYKKSYFSAGRAFEERHGYLRFFPKPVVDWYFANCQQKLEIVMRDHARYLPNPKGLKILEIGTGEGKFLQYCGKENIIGIDLWEEGIAQHRKNGFDVRFHDASKRLPFENNAFDVVYSSFVIEHIRNGADFTAEIRRVLKENGVAIIRTADMKRCGAWFYTDYTHVQPYTVESLYRVMEDNGLEVKELAHGITPPGFILRRVGNLAVLLPKIFQDIYFKRVCPMFSYEIYVVASKKGAAQQAAGATTRSNKH